jgi:hypothetical protein
MFLRVTKRRKADGSEVAYYQLAENEWDPTRGRAVAKIVYNFGRADELDPQALRRLSASILRVVDETTGSRGDEVAPDLHLRDAWPYGGSTCLSTCGGSLAWPK